MRVLRLIFAKKGPWLNQTNQRRLAFTRACTDIVQLDVGGHKFTIQNEHVRKYPTSTLYQMTQSVKGEIAINRDGPLFEHIKAYLLYGYLPRTADGKVTLDYQTLKELGAEAEFYGIHALSAECNTARRNTVGPDFQSYFKIKDYIERVLKEHYYDRSALTDFHVTLVPLLTHALKCLWVPFCVVHKLFFHKPKFDLKVADLVSSPFLSALNTSQNCTFDATKLDVTALDKITDNLTEFKDVEALAPHLELTLIPKELIIHQAGSEQSQCRVLPNSIDIGHIGTLVVILNSEYTGGELEVTHGGRTEVVTGPYSWVAMYGDCLHKINPVTSGTRASLVFDIYGKNRKINGDDRETCFQKGGGLSAPRKAPNLIDTLRLPSNAHRRRILKNLDVAMQARDTLVVGLQHQYHYNDGCYLPTVDMLSGGDRVLYEMLMNSGDYDVKILSFTLNGELMTTNIKLYSIIT